RGDLLHPLGAGVGFHHGNRGHHAIDDRKHPSRHDEPIARTHGHSPLMRWASPVPPGTKGGENMPERPPLGNTRGSRSERRAGEARVARTPISTRCEKTTAPAK